MLIAISKARELAVDLALVKEHLRIDHDSDDNLLQSLLLSAIKQIEEKTGWALSETDYEWDIESGDLNKSIPLYPVKITSDHSIKGGVVNAKLGDQVLFTTSISHQKDALLPAILLTVQALYEATSEEQIRLDSAVTAICKSVRRSLGV